MEQNKQMKRYLTTWSMAALLLLILTGGMVQGQVQEEWVARYDGPGNGFDASVAIALDEAGNVYVTGWSIGSSGVYENDYATIKYDTDGNELWVARYDGPGNDDDYARAIAVDAWGNVYVTGSSRSGSTSVTEDYATIKYDTNGNELWVARYNGPGNNSDQPNAIALDETGNVSVTGNSYSIGSSNDYATVKYDTNGNQLWTALYNGPGNDNDAALNIAVDGFGNIYVTGRSRNSPTSDPLDYTTYDCATIKYDVNGTQLWVARYDGPGNGEDSVGGLAVEPSGNVYVTGSTYAGTKRGNDIIDYATVKYDTNGSQLWVARYSHLRSGQNYATDIAVDTLGNTYVTGYSFGKFSARDYATIKYDTDGNQLWLVRFDGLGDDWAWDLALDASGNVYVTGDSQNVPVYYDDYATIKYSQYSGNQFPVADAGSDQTVIDVEGDEYELVTLDGTASFDPDGIIISWEWKSGENILGYDPVLIDVIFPIGAWPVTLTVTDNEGAIDTDEVIITVAEDVPFINAPSNLVASVSKKTVTLTWSDNSDNEEGFFIERRPKKSSVYEPIGQVGPEVTTFVDSGLAKGRYYYRVQAFSDGTLSDYSNVAGANVR